MLEALNRPVRPGDDRVVVGVVNVGAVDFDVSGPDRTSFDDDPLVLLPLAQALCSAGPPRLARSRPSARTRPGCSWLIHARRQVGYSARPQPSRLRDLDAQGDARDVATINVPAPGPTAYGVRRDLAHTRTLVITNCASGDGPAHHYWLVDFGCWTAA